MKYLLTLLSGLSLICQVSAQGSSYNDNIDSLKRVNAQPGTPDSVILYNLWEISEAYYYYHDDSLDLGIKYAEDCIKLAESLGRWSWCGACYNNIGRILASMAKLDEAIDAYELGMEYYLRPDGRIGTDSMRAMMLYDNTSYCLGDMGRYDEALVVKNRATNYFKRYGDSSTIAASLYGVGALYIAKEEYERAIPYHREALTYTVDWPLLEGEAYADLLIMNRNLGKYDSLSYFYKKANEQLETIPTSIAALRYNYGLAQELMGKPDSAIYYMRLAVNSDGQNPVGEMYNLYRVTLADMLAKRGQTREARKIYDVAAPFVKNSEKLKHKISVLQTETRLLTAEGKYRQALIVTDSLHAAQEKAKALSVEKNFEELETKYETDKKNQQIKALSLEDELNEARIKNRNRWLWALGVGLLGLLGLLYNIFRQKSIISEQRDQLSKSLEEKNVLLKEIHHRVKNNLQVISSLLGLQSRFVTDDAAQQALSVGKSRVQSMSLLHQKLYTNKDLKSVNIKSYFEDLIANLMATYQIEDDAVTFTTEIADLDLDIDTVVPLGLITNELISNALKHAFTDGRAGKVDIRVTNVDGRVTMVVSDNGKGVPFTTIPLKTKSLGLQLIRSFTEKLDGELHIDNSAGSTFTISFAPQRQQNKLN